MIYTLCPFCGERIERKGDEWQYQDCECGAYIYQWLQGEGELVWRTGSRTSVICEESEVEE